MTGSQGWSSPQLVPLFAGKPLDDILDLQFIATQPPQSQKADGFVPIGAVFPLEQGHPFKGVRVRAWENAIEVKQIPGSNQTNINVNGCKDCIGKKFVERGQAQPGQDSTVARDQRNYAQPEPAQSDPRRRLHDCRSLLGVTGTALQAFVAPADAWDPGQTKARTRDT